MSVTVSYTGQFGNCMFQYVNARLYAESMGVKLMTPFPSKYKDIIQFKNQIGVGVSGGPYHQIVSEKNIDSIELYRDWIYDFSGFFQQSFRYIPHRELIKSWLVKPYETTNFKDIVIHLRADDYGKAHRIHPQWFTDILAKEEYENIYIVMNPIDTDYLNYFLNNHSVKLQSGTIKEDFEFIASFSKIICSNSTFCWWAAFLGNPEKVYTFKKWLPDNPQIDLTELPNGVVVDGDFWI